MRRSVVVFLVVLAAGGILLAVTALDDRYRLAFTLGARAAVPVGTLAPGDRACQGPIDVPADAERVRYRAQDAAGRRPTLELSVRAGDAPSTSTIGRIEKGRHVSVCLRNTGAAPVALFGEGGAATPSELTVDGRRSVDDMSLVFERADPGSFASSMPEMVRRAALFRPAWVSSGLLWALTVMFLVGAPCLLAIAISRAEQE
jgi:hypothetical protein